MINIIVTIPLAVVGILIVAIESILIDLIKKHLFVLSVSIIMMVLLLAGGGSLALSYHLNKAAYGVEHSHKSTSRCSQSDVDLGRCTNS